MSIIYDSHIHLMPIRGQDGPQEFLAKATEVGIGGGMIFSLPPSEALMPSSEARTEAAPPVMLTVAPSRPS